MNAILTMSNFIFPLITFPYVSRILLPEGTGKVSFATSLIYYFTMVAQLGIPTYGIRKCAQVRDDRRELSKTAHELLMINMIMTVVSYSVLAVALLTVPRLQTERLLYIVVSSTIFLTAIGMEWLYKAMEQYTYITIRSIVFKFIAMVAMFLLVHEKEDYVIYGGITVLASSASFLLNFINVRKYIDLHLLGEYDFRRHLKPILVFFFMSIATTIYTHLDTILLGFLKTDTDVGYYNAAVKIKTILVSIVTSLGVVLLPRVSYYIEQKKIEEFKEVSQNAIAFVLLLSIPLCVYFILFAAEGVYFLSGNAYTGSVIPMQIVMPTLVFIGLSNILGIQILVPTGREKVVLRSEIFGALANLTVNLALIPKLACIGAAIGNVTAELVVLLIQFLSMGKEVTPYFTRMKYWKIIVAVLLGSVLAVQIKILNLGLFVTLLISAILFFLTYLVVLVLLKEEMCMKLYSQIKGKFIRRM